jgi:hypothetical protein
VPVGITSLLVDAKGAGGGGSASQNNNLGGLGARVQATLSVVPGQVLQVLVGGAGSTSTGIVVAGGYNGGGAVRFGGGGGGATDIRSSGGALADRLLVAAGGGGSGSHSTGSQGGAGGAPIGGNGSGAGNFGGGGGTQTSGGSAGGALSTSGALGTGGTGNTDANNTGGGGGGGGYYGGGGASRYNGGGGGASWAMPTGITALTLTAGANAGNGSLTLTPATVYAAPVLDGSNFVNVPGDNLGNHTATQNLDLAANQLVGNGGSTGLTISSIGNVGIGVTTPSQKLHVAGNVNVSGNSYVGGRVGIGTASPGYPLTVQADAGSRVLGISNSGGTDKYNFSLGSTGLNLSESNVAAGRLFIEDGGNVGIGTTDPGAKLHVAGNMKIDGANTLEFGAGVVGKEVNAGKIGYGTFSGGTSLDIIGAGTGSNRVVRVYAESGLGVSGPVNASSFNNNSDARFKNHVRPIGSALSSVLALCGVRYEWNALGVAHGGRAGAPQVGLIAQELEKVYPELVSTDAEGYKAINYAQLTPVLIEALKELKAENDALKARATTAETQAAQATATTDAFEARLRRLEAGGGQAQR